MRQSPARFIDPREPVNLEELQAFAGRNPMLSIALVGLTLAIIVTEIARLFRGYKAIKPVELTRLINSDNALVVDLSAAADYEKGHIAGSRNAVAGKFDAGHKLVTDRKSQPVVLVCRNGTASAAAAKKLKQAGFEKVYWLEGGIPAWQQADLPLVKGRA
ncbi:membrane protein [[Pseudomonas] boreopolis]|uniref:Membrane protein n=1 Tax=Xanthomonas boreopolis TaxID=86183 RepID=A0A919KIM8_9XANT|nr:membrane protein [[Pseudomonas] boreopolis]